LSPTGPSATSGATITGTLNEVRAGGKVSLCHREGNGSYHLIGFSASAEPAHRKHGDAAIGERVPGDATKVFTSACEPGGASVSIESSTNGQNADEAPGPIILVGSAVTWQYLVTNTGDMDLTNVRVRDDQNVTVTCAQTRLAAGQSMTCTGSGVAIRGEYRNVGTVTADWAAGTVTDSDPSHYSGRFVD
jgi:hypothetical protein